MVLFGKHGSWEAYGAVCLDLAHRPPILQISLPPRRRRGGAARDLDHGKHRSPLPSFFCPLGFQEAPSAALEKAGLRRQAARCDGIGGGLR